MLTANFPKPKSRKSYRIFCLSNSPNPKKISNIHVYQLTKLLTIHFSSNCGIMYDCDHNHVRQNTA